MDDKDKNLIQNHIDNNEICLKFWMSILQLSMF